MSASKWCLSQGAWVGVVTPIFPCRKALFADARPILASRTPYFSVDQGLPVPSYRCCSVDDGRILTPSDVKSITRSGPGTGASGPDCPGRQCAQPLLPCEGRQ